MQLVVQTPSALLFWHVMLVCRTTLKPNGGGGGGEEGGYINRDLYHSTAKICYTLILLFAKMCGMQPHIVWWLCERVRFSSL